MPSFAFSRASATATPVDQPPHSESPSVDDISRPESRRVSRGTSEIGYPSWLPQRPPPPVPRSTIHSDIITETPRTPSVGPSVAFGGRKPTPRSVRIVSLRGNSYLVERETTDDKTRVPSDSVRDDNHRAWSRATAPHIRASTSETYAQDKIPEPRFNAKALNIDLLESPSLLVRSWFYFMRILIFVHIPLQSFLDLNIAFMLIQVAKFPTPEALGIPGSGKNWALAAGAYIACWFLWLFIVFLVYEFVYSFIRRWRIKRPLMYPIYLSSPAFNLVAISSYQNFCFLQYIRYSAFVGDLGSLRDGLAETCWFYSQNIPTVILLLPRAGISLALIFAFKAPDIIALQLANSGFLSQRDQTFFRPIDGTLTNYATGILWTNIAWTGWKVFVVFTSWIGLWMLSGASFGGLCGPRYRWEEEEGEKTLSIYSDNASALDDIPWNWKERTRLRILDAFEFCLTIKPHHSESWRKRRKRYSHAEKHAHGPEEKDIKELLGSAPGTSGLDEDGVQRVLAAIGLPSVPQPARRPILTEDFFEGPSGEVIIPRTETPPELAADDKQKGKKRRSAEAKRRSSPYPFTSEGAAFSSEDRIPFPPSPLPSERAKSSSSNLDGGDDEDVGEDDEDAEGDDEGGGLGESEDPSSGRPSGSMSSLGQPMGSRYPFQSRQHHRQGSTQSYSNSNSRSMASRASQGTQSTGNRQTTTSDSMSQRSPLSTGSDPVPPIPMPPRHPRARSGTVPAPGIPTFPPARERPRVGSAGNQTFGVPSPLFYGRSSTSDSDVNAQHVIGMEEHEVPSEQEENPPEQPEPEGSVEEAEGDDVVGLLSSSRGPSPRPSYGALRQRGSNLSISTRRSGLRSGSGSGSGSRTTSHSGSSSRSRVGSISISVAVRSRAQSLLQNVESASRSSIDLVQGAIRSRANSSMARLEENTPNRSSQEGRTHSRSGSGSVSRSDQPSSGADHTFGQPLRPPEQIVEEQSEHSDSHEQGPEPSSP